MRIGSVLRGGLAGTVALILILLAGLELGLARYSPYFGPAGDRIFLIIYGTAWGGIATIGFLILWLILATLKVRVHWFWVPVLLIAVEWLKELFSHGLIHAGLIDLLNRGTLEVSIAGVLGWLAAFGRTGSVQATLKTARK